MYEIAVDPHTHSVASGHAFSTVLELATFAKLQGLAGLVLTDHSPSMPGGPVFFYPGMFPNLPKELAGVRVYYGMELDIVDGAGAVGLEEKYLHYLEFGIASFHSFTIAEREDYTNAALGALNNPHVDMLGHPGNPRYPLDIKAVVNEARRLDKLIEINNHSPKARKGSAPRCLEFLTACKQQGVRVAVSSDAHIATAVGQFPHSVSLLEEAAFPEELIVNRTLKGFEEYLSERAARLAAGKEAR